MHSLANVNWLAVFIAPLSGFVLGFLWYGPVFGRAWMKLTGMTKEKGAEANMALTFGGTYLLNVVVAIGLSVFLHEHSGLHAGLHAGVFAGLFFFATALGVVFLFEQKPFKLWLIDAGYQIVNFAAIGAILGAWPA